MVSNFNGLMGHLVLFSQQPSDPEMATLALPQDALYVAPVDGGDLTANGATEAVDVLPSAHYQPPATVDIASGGQPANSILTVDGSNRVVIDPGGVAGIDSGTFRVDGFPAILSFNVLSAPPSGDPRDAFWQADGYTKVWSSTPAQGDVGIAASTYFDTKWNNGQSNITSNFPTASLGTVQIVNHADGTPCVRCILNQGTVTLFLVTGNQLASSTKSHAVFSVEVFSPTVGGVNVHDILGKGFYTGIGGWGGEPGVTHSPGGSTNYDDAWHMRAPLNGVLPLRLFIYAYPARVLPNTSSGVGYTQQTEFSKGSWFRVELEVISNTAGSSNGRLRLYQAETLIREVTNTVIRLTSNTYPRGWKLYLSSNSGTVTDGGTTATIYYRNWRIFTK